MRGLMKMMPSGRGADSANPGSASRRQVSGSAYVVGRDSHGRWTALAAGGRAGGVFRSKDAALRYAQTETGRAPGAVRLAASPVDLPFTGNQIGRGDGLPAWWRLERATREGSSFTDRMPIARGIDGRWLAIDLGLVAGLAGLCLTLALVLS